MAQHPAPCGGMLVIHDDPTTLAVLTDVLAAAGVQVTSSTAPDAVGCVRGPHSPAVVLVGGRLLDGDVEAVRGRLPREGTRVPLVLLAGGTPERLDALQRATRAVAVLAPPVDPATVRSVIGALLGGFDEATILEKLAAHLLLEGEHASTPSTCRCPVCRWLLYVGRPDFVQGAFAGRRTGRAIRCPGCGHTTPFPPAHARAGAKGGGHRSRGRDLGPRTT